MIRAWALLLALLALPARAGGFASPRGGERLRPDSLETASLRIPSEVVREAEEMELLLSLDGGRTFPVRLTRELSPGIAALTWRVPNLPSECARLAIRTGSEERGEEIQAVSEEFSIATDPAAPLEPLRRVLGEWRPLDALDGPAPGTLPERGIDMPRETLRSDSREADVDNDAASLLAARPPRVLPPGAGEPEGGSLPETSPVPRLPLKRPMRE